MIKFRTESTAYSVTPRITEIEVERESENSVWVQGRRLGKVTTFDIYWDSWDEAHAHLLRSAENHCHVAHRQLERANGALGNVKGMKKPAGA